MSAPSVTVRRAPDGWTHIGGPGMHLLIALDEEDELTLTASDAADGGDLDDVIDVLTAGGLRKSHHFVGVHWLPRTRIVAHGPVVATITTTDGAEREVRATSPRVWTDVEFDEHPAQVDLRVLEESELTTPAPAATPTTQGPEPVRAAPLTQTAAPSLDLPATSSGQSVTPAPPATAERPAPRPVPTFGATGGDPESRPGRTWAGNWGATPVPSPSPSPSEPSSEPEVPVGQRDFALTRRVEQSSEPEVPDAESPSPAPPRLPAWGQARPQAVRRSAAESAARDIHSTWTSRPSEPTMREIPEPAPPPQEASPPPSEDAEPPSPSYDYLFGHTTTVEEHRRFLATLDGGTNVEEEDGDLPSPDAPAPDSTALEPSAAPAQDRSTATPSASSPSPPLAPAASDAAGSGGLISSVPWASSSSPSSAQPSSGQTAASPPNAEPPAAIPSFSGRHSPPPAPSLRPPLSPTQQTPTPPAAPAPAPAATPAQAATPAPHQTPVPQSIAALPDDAELTVDRSALLQGTGPTVMAVLCPAGHASPPHADRCRSCGSAVPPQEAFAMPRPPLGVLRLSTGDVVTLDRNVLLGRAPKPAHGLAPDAQPHVVKVPSPERDVSRNHVEVLVDGWHVLLRDLGTTNGTTVALPGEAPVRLRAHDEQSLEPGSVVSMADEVSFTFEVGG